MKNGQIKGVLISQVRGEDGDEVKSDLKLANVMVGMRVGQWLRANFPQIHWFIPHDYELAIDWFWCKGILTSDQILDMTCSFAKNSQIAIVYNGISEGMRREIQACGAKGVPIVKVSECNNEAKKKIVRKMRLAGLVCH